MSNSNYADEAAKLQGKKEVSKKRTMRKCSYTGCPLKASTYFSGINACSFHDSPDFHQQVTIAIKSHIRLINAYNKMVNWSISDWVKNKPWLETNKFYQKTDEINSVYLVNFLYKISELISNDATKLVKKMKGAQYE